MGLTRRQYCGVLFWLKALIAFGIGVTTLVLMSVEIRRLYLIGYANRPKLAPSVSIPSGGCPVSAKLARLEPPAGIQMSGFHLDWSKMTPLQLKGKLGFSPTVVYIF
jgi:hypothetical protein